MKEKRRKKGKKMKYSLFCYFIKILFYDNVIHAQYKKNATEPSYECYCSKTF